MKTDLKEPCHQCPFRRTSIQGWLGPWNPEDLLHQVSYGEFPCHCTIKKDGADTTNMQVCVGAVTYLNNKMQRSRDPQMSAAQNLHPADHRLAFSNPQEFIAHHRGGKVRSWKD